MVFTMTKAEALSVQAAQIDYYAGVFGEGVRDIVAAATRADEIANGTHTVLELNRVIPRGGRIEQLILAAGLPRLVEPTWAP